LPPCFLPTGRSARWALPLPAALSSPSFSSALPAEPDERTDSLAAAVTDVSEKLGVLVREEIELAKAEMVDKASTLARGAAAGAAGAVFGVFALIFVLLTVAWGINSATTSLWIGFAVVMVLLIALTVGAFLFAWRKLRVGPPTPKMAIDEAKRISETVRPGGEA
jgi:putative superfamily III holin-X